MDRDAIEAEIERVRKRLLDLDAERIALEAALAGLRRELTSADDTQSRIAQEGSRLTNNSPAGDKIALFRTLFAGRSDVFPTRWENQKTGRSGYSPACFNEWVKGACGKPKVKCGECPNQAFIPVSDDTIAKHLRGADARSAGFVAGVYPLLSDETCWFLAADFDKQDWKQDAEAFLQTCHGKGIEACLERSRSGNGGHVWIFFSQPVSARLARQMGAALITETMERRPEIGFSSYDRFFPNQDTMPIGGFGNLIALPLQRRAREAGNSVFVDTEFRPYDDQWAFLSALNRNSAEAIVAIADEAELSGRILGVRTPVEEEFADEPWRMPPSRCNGSIKIAGPLPETMKIVIADQIYIERAALPAPLVTQFVRLAAFQNPEFYRAQAMRLPTFGKPRIVSCAELHSRHVALPRGCLDEAVALARQQGIGLVIEDLRESGQPLPKDVAFRGELSPPQQCAFANLVAHDHGVLAATTAFGKTVVAIALIAKRNCSALVLVHRREILDQWVKRLRSFLNIDPKQIGVIGGGKRKPTGIVDVALI